MSPPPLPPALPLASQADREALAEVLARPEFRDRSFDGTALRRLLSDLWDRLLESLGTAEAERYASVGRAVFLGAVAAAALLAWRALRRRARRRTAPRVEGGTPDLPAAAREPATARGAGLELARGELAGAVRLAYAAAAAAVGARGLPAAGQAFTGPELAARADDPGFGELTRLHDRTVFGRRAPEPAEARRAVEVAERLAPGPTEHP